MSDSQITKRKVIKIIGVSEEKINDVLSKIITKDGPKIKMVKKDLEIDVYLQASAESEEEAIKIIKPVSKELKKNFAENIYSTKDEKTLEIAVVDLLAKNDITVTTAESCTGGLIAARLVNVPGVSDVFKEGFVTYSNKAKRKTLDVSKQTLKKYGAVSKQTAKEMATGAVFAADADVSVAVTGIAGPDGGSDEKPVGLVFIGCYMNDRVTVEEYHFEGDRGQIREQSVNAALNLLRKTILDNTR